ncbi:unnamed protein product [Spirodela intermedia]|uniref:RING-type E3 ubiquitin transferase n=1 Tax=Spirodela intermedia TaxID=51605 RepID=A0A7I8KI32_SPIIN|nr:unnamed protein product [Spirodela intermedia]
MFTPRYGLQNGVMLTAILSLAFVVLLVVLLHLYIRLFLRRHQAGRQVNPRFSVAGTMGALDTVSVEFPKAGLDPSVLSALPTFKYMRADGGGAASTVDCAVCLAALEEGELTRLLPTCRHVFHVECIDMWLYSHTSCPICRAEVEAPPTLSCSPAGSAQLPEQDSGSVDPPAAAAVGEATFGTYKDQESSTSRLNLSLRRMLSRASSQRSASADVLPDIERE